METKIDIIDNVTSINIISNMINYLETYIDQTSSTHLHIFLLIVGILIILICILIAVLLNKFLSKKVSYRSTETQVIG